MKPYDVVVDTASRSLIPWTARIDPFIFSADTPFFSLLVPTVDTTRYRHLCTTLMRDSKHVLLMGETGVGKSVVVQALLNGMAQSGDSVTCTISYSAQTTPLNVQEVFESKLEKKRKNLLGPPSGKGMLVFVDDFNMPALEEYGAQPPNELLRQVIDLGGFYDLDKLFLKNVKGVTFAAACAPPGGGRNEVSPRLTRRFNMLWAPTLSSKSMNAIFTAILGGFTYSIAPALNESVHALVEASIEIYDTVEREMLPTPARSHYTFNLRDLSKVFQGMLMVTATELVDTDAMLRLWLHEECRVFRDRLIDDEDRSSFNALPRECLQVVAEAPPWEPEEFTTFKPELSEAVSKEDSRERKKAERAE